MKISEVNVLLEEFYKSFNEIEDISLKQFMKDVTKTELHVIEAIGEESLTMNALSEKLGITMGTATVAINKLTSKGFIKRERCDEDRRKVFVSLSPEGIKAFEYHTKFHTETVSAIIKDLDEHEVDNFVEVFKKIQKNLIARIENMKPVLLNDIPENQKFRVVEIKGTPGMKDFFKTKNIKNSTVAEILRRDADEILIDINGNSVRINNVDARNISVVKE